MIDVGVVVFLGGYFDFCFVYNCNLMVVWFFVECVDMSGDFF